MDYHKILRTLTTKSDDKIDFNEKLGLIMNRVYEELPVELKKNIDNKCDESNDNSVRRKYLQTILHVLCALRKDVLSISETFMSVNEYRGVKVAIETAISIGILPCLLPGIGVGLNKLCPNAAQLPQESQTELQKYDRLATTTRVLTDIYDEISLRPAIIQHLGPLLGALFQLAHVPLMKPSNVNANSSEFQMTEELYGQLINDQVEFRHKLNHLIKNCPQSCIMKELMVLSGLSNAPNWLKRKTRLYLVEAITGPTGVMSLINATCEDTLDVGMHWERLDTISKLIATSHLKDSEKYYNAVCSQLLSILSSKNIKHAANIANCCITALYEAHPEICERKIFHVVAAPFIIGECADEKNSVIRSETEISESIDSLMKCFLMKDSKFQSLPHTLLRKIALPLFNIHTKIYESASLLKSKVRELLIHLLKYEKTCDNLFSVFLKHDSVHCEDFGERLCIQFGSTGGVEIKGKYQDSGDETNWGELADSLFDLVKLDEKLSLDLLNYLFKWLTRLNKNKSKLAEGSDLNSYNDLIKIVCQQAAAQSLLSNLANTNSIQKAVFKSPESVLSFATSLFPETINDNEESSEDFDTLYTSLMLVKVMVMEAEKSIDWTPFNNFSNVLKEKMNLKLPPNLLTLIREVVDAIKTRGKAPRFQDLAIDNRQKEDFEKALRDLADPLLPVRAHGLMTMTKLIESSDPVAMAKKDLILCFFQENLKDDDSFVYLTAINGLCAMALTFPQQVIEVLVQQFIDMPQRNKNGEIAPENRAKLGEILVKTTRALGDMAPAYKNILINGFLCGVRDSDSMVRASSLSCLGELCKVLGFRLGNTITEVLYCIGCIIQTDKSQECRRAAVLVITLLIRGLGKDVLNDLANDLLPVYRSLKYLRDNDDDDVLRLHAQLALEELDDIVQNILFTKPALEKNIFLLS